VKIEKNNKNLKGIRRKKLKLTRNVLNCHNSKSSTIQDRFNGREKGFSDAFSCSVSSEGDSVPVNSTSERGLPALVQDQITALLPEIKDFPLQQSSNTMSNFAKH